MKTNIIAIVGSPRSGKSFLTKKLGEKLGAEVFLEKAEEFPSRIVEDIQNGIRSMERAVFFRNLSVANYSAALRLGEKGSPIIVDTFMASTPAHGRLILDDFEFKLFDEMIAIDLSLFPYPDLTIFLKTTEENIRQFIKAGGREFDTAEDHITSYILPVNTALEAIYSPGSYKGNLLVVDRADRDFATDKDFDWLMDQITTCLNK